jgi:hypothetical protein
MIDALSNNAKCPTQRCGQPRPARSSYAMRSLPTLLLLHLCLAFGARADDKITFTGSWDQKDAKAVSFSLSLRQIDHRIEGYHTAVVLYTRSHHLDAIGPEDGDGPSITGTVSGGKAHVRFRSANGATGTALLERQGNKLVWTTVSSTAGHLFPSHAVLDRADAKRK